MQMKQNTCEVCLPISLNVLEFARNSTRPGPPRNESFGSVEVESVLRTNIALEFKVLEREREE